MQQTEKYKLDLIEKTDNFSPDPLNANAKKVDAALATVIADAQAVNAELEGRVTVLEARKIVFGSYAGTGNQTTQAIALGFKPKIVIGVVVKGSSASPSVAILDSYMLQHSGHCLTLHDTGFTAGYNMNDNGCTYRYMAFG